VLALQGDFKEHITALKQCGVEVVEVRLPKDLNDLDGLIIPGGESTTFRILLEEYGLSDVIVKKFRKGMGVYGTCAGAICLAKKIEGEQPVLGLMNISVKRNAYGGQLESFEVPLEVYSWVKEFPGVFIRAPTILKVGSNVEVLSSYKGDPVFVREGNLLVSTFHPELSGDLRVHEFFVDMLKNGV